MPYSPAIIIEAAAISDNKTHCGIDLPKINDTAVAAMPPISICPSPPIFQNFILNASDRPVAVITSGIVPFTVSLIRNSFPNAPFNITTNTLNGLKCMHKSRILTTIKENTNAITRIINE